MDGANTFNPSDLANMANQVDENQTFSEFFDFNDGDMVYDPSFDLVSMEQAQGSEYVGEPLAPVQPFLDQQNFAQAPQEMVPMQQSLNPSPATLIPSQGFPAVPAGWAYHPAVGWHFPAPASFNMPMPNVGFPGPMIPEAPIAPISAFDAPLPTETGKKSVTSEASSRNKRKYGPSAYLAEQANRRAAGDLGGPRPVSRESVDFHYQGRSTRVSTRITKAQATPVQRKKAKANPVTTAAGNMKELNTAVVQQCRCKAARSAKVNHIPRPRNAFIIFRNDFAAKWRTPKGEKRGKSNTHISSAAGQAWKEASERTKANYKKRADQEAKEHKEQYPEYHYAPMKSIQAKFGDSSCTCGAYQTNVAELQRLRNDGRTPSNHSINVGNSDSEGEGRVSSRTRSQSRADIYEAPVAPMVPEYSFDQTDNFDFGFQNDSNDFGMEALQTWNVAQEEPPVNTRRSSRNAFKSVHYTDDQAEDEDEDEVMAFTTPRKHRPAPISTSRKSSVVSPLTRIGSADWNMAGVEGDNVASRTRSKSISIASESPANSLFDDDDDVIVVATPAKPSPKAVKLALPGRATRSQSRGRKTYRS